MVRDYTPAHPAGVQEWPAIIWCTDPERRLMLPFRPHIARQSGGQVWRERHHDRGQASTEWEGKRLHTLTLSVFLTALRNTAKTDIEPECALLHQMMVGEDWTQRREPVPVRLNFGPGQQMRWVITDITWGAEPVIDHRGRRIQTEAEVELLEFVRPPLADSPAKLADLWRQR
ncbi:hypothetical protein [Stomatohabitans albus]|uniref:hypothetical protein n=1 Tax=Stomatohabitans albus TaxID=3110766 RepID=UPI00300D9BF5